jgi:hypothetical protein
MMMNVLRNVAKKDKHQYKICDDCVLAYYTYFSLILDIVKDAWKLLNFLWSQN